MTPPYDRSGLLVRSNSGSSMSTTAPDLLLELDRSRPRGLRAQIEGGLRDAISAGRLSPGTSLPSTRALAADLGVTRGVVVAAYDQLLAEGYLLARQGVGTVVNSAPVSTDRAVVAATVRRPPSSTSCRAFRSSPRFRGRRGCGRRGPPSMRSPTGTSATATRAACPSCAAQSPSTSVVSAVSSPTPTKWSSATGSPTASASSPVN